MAKFFTLSPESVPLNPVLIPTFVRTFWAAGHEFTNDIREADAVLLDLHTRIADYKQSDVDYLLSSSLPIAVFCEFDRGSMSDEVWPNPLTPQQQSIFQEINNGKIKSVHFCRLLDKTQTYRYNLYPYEKGILHEEPPVSMDELFYRQFDIAMIANSSPNRESIKLALEADGRLKCDILLGAKKLEFPDFLSRHKRAKLFVNSSAGGYTCERPQLLFSVAGMIRQRTDQLLLHEFTHLENCIQIDSPPTQKDLDDLFYVVNNKEKLYEIYLNGINFVKRYYSKEYIAKNILSIIEKEIF